jgi:4-hydroxy-2-oxoglutarate aldolase
VADRSPLPVILYSIPKFTAGGDSAGSGGGTGPAPEYLGLKESSGSVERVREVVQATRWLLGAR